jgi:tetratricopeptide (TPR) repeat protein
MCQWIHATSIDPADFRLVVRTFADAFPDAQVWTLEYDCLLIGGAPRLDAGRIERALSDEALGRDLARCRVRDVADFFRHLGPSAEAFAGPGELHCDDRPVLEFRGPRMLYLAPTAILAELSAPEVPLLPPNLVAGAPAGFAEALERSRAVFRWGQRIDALAFADAPDLAPALAAVSAFDDDRLAALIEHLLERRQGGLLNVLCRDASLRGRIGRLARDRANASKAWRTVAEIAAGDDPTELSALGEALMAVKDLRGARAALERAIQKNPREARAHYFLGLVAGEEGDLERAVGHFKRAAALEPQNPNIHYNLGYALEKLGKAAEAEEAYRTTLKLDRAPRETRRNASTGLGRVLLEREGASAATLAAFEEAVKLDDGGDPQLLDYLGGLYERAGRTEDAATCRKRAEDLRAAR